MPIYEYKCNACDHEFEKSQKMADPPVKTCPKCKQKKVEKLISLSAFSLKGEGWYVTEYGTKKGKSDSNVIGDPPAHKTEAAPKSDVKTAKKAKGKKTAAKKAPKAKSQGHIS